jgi:hypothetical protein
MNSPIYSNQRPPSVLQEQQERRWLFGQQDQVRTDLCLASRLWIVWYYYSRAQSRRKEAKRIHNKQRGYSNEKHRQVVEHLERPCLWLGTSCPQPAVSFPPQAPAAVLRQLQDRDPTRTYRRPLHFVSWRKVTCHLSFRCLLCCSKDSHHLLQHIMWYY